MEGLERNQESDLAQVLLDIKRNDLRLNSSQVPERANLIDKMFARSLGMSAGRIIEVYDNIYQQSQGDTETNEAYKTIRGIAGRKSKLNVNLPLIGKTNARFCGLVAMNYSSLFDNEFDIYRGLSRDLEGRTVSGEEIISEVRDIAESQPEKYGALLEKRQQSVYDFGVLMGFNDNPERMQELSQLMPEKISDYFSKVTKVHKGNKLGMRWPISLKKFSRPILDSLSADSIMYSIQEGIGNDYVSCTCYIIETRENWRDEK